ncbi:carbamoyltransferase HypF [candidate division TA06 bacterium B3_TA06]|uniref:Carbamoyltransferase n=1 Tax=candidate division TA06 bacterium B3_TA06 TaxID=2012487 RepID=A0A532V6F2_UNCT6|nr:MAG: carbamoyltransferase HypF [candidate division TA06 bacterium B3_TA06]
MSAVNIRVAGAVQGVGLRPFCYREATRRGLAGFVLNDLGGVVIFLEGSREAIEGFVYELRNNPPPASCITGIEVQKAEEQGLRGFRILQSEAGQASQELQVSADLATCHNCRREILNPPDRRHRYAFTNCTDCGPRYTIISSLPYDRPKTTMAEFKMCEDCQREYDDPSDRRFHAQPDACPVCGPELVLFDASGRVLRCKDPIKETVRLLLSEKTVAVKGLGGYHLMCDAMDPESVERLRKRKRRAHKPLAVMCANIEQARSLAVISREEELVLRAPAAPILLLPWNPDVGEDIRAALAPLNPGVGIMLAYTPIHHLMFATDLEGKRLNPLVATSANRGDEPIIADELELFDKVGDVIDAVLAHNRRIANRIDDSVALVSSDSPSGSPRGDEVSSRGEIHLIRRARGFAPAPIETPFCFPPSLAVGAEMKGSFAVAAGNRVWLSPHIGELSGRASMEFFEQTLTTYLRWFHVEPEVVVCDAHPDYLSTRWAERYAEDKGIRLYRVQHHHAHVASVMFEHEIEEEVIGLALDGTGYGPHPADDYSSIWGCELLYVHDRGGRFKRLGHLKPLPLVGGELAIRRPRRMAAGVIADLFGKDKAIEMFGKEGEIAGKLLERENDVLRVLRGVVRGVLRASSAGRLFDAVAGLIGLVDEITFEAQAPVALESLCPADLEAKSGYPFEIGSNLILDPAPCFAAIIEDMEKGLAPSEISARFHLGFARVLVDWLVRAREMTGTSTVALSGGVFVNRTLVRLLNNLARKERLLPLLPRLIPATDGGLAAGQLLAARALIELEPIKAQTT